MEIKELFETKAFVKSGVTFQTPKQILEPFMDKMSKYTDKFIIKTSEKIVNANEDESINAAFGRVLIQTDFSGDDLDGMYKNVGVVYALDTLKPIVKTYTGTIVSACTNMCIFNADHIFSSNIMEGLGRPLEYITQYLGSMEQVMDNYRKIRLDLTNQIYTENEIQQKLGELLEYSIKNKYLGTTAVVNAAKNLYDNSSMYHIENKQTTAWNLYNSITQYLTDKSDIIDTASKTLLLSKFFIN
jgi:hypothetical protein